MQGADAAAAIGDFDNIRPDGESLAEEFDGFSGEQEGLAGEVDDGAGEFADEGLFNLPRIRHGGQGEECGWHEAEGDAASPTFPKEDMGGGKNEDHMKQQRWPPPGIGSGYETEWDDDDHAKQGDHGYPEREFYYGVRVSCSIEQIPSTPSKAGSQKWNEPAELIVFAKAPSGHQRPEELEPQENYRDGEDGHGPGGGKVWFHRSQRFRFRIRKRGGPTSRDESRLPSLFAFLLAGCDFLFLVGFVFAVGSVIAVAILIGVTIAARAIVSVRIVLADHAADFLETVEHKT